VEAIDLKLSAISHFDDPSARRSLWIEDEVRAQEQH
jgi:hypothetical protein